MADSWYINQANSRWKNHPFKGSTVGASGCIVCCAAMVICKHFGISKDDEKLQVIEAVISNCTDNEGDFERNPSIKYKDTTFAFLRRTAKPNYRSLPIVYYRYIKGNSHHNHAVLATSPTTVLDPGNYRITTVEAANKQYKSSDMAYWTHTSLGGDDSFDCDTHSTVTIQRGNKYTARITCSQYPKVVAGTGGIVSISLASRSGNNYYFAFTGVSAGSTGIYINNRSSAVFVCKVV